MKNKYAPKYPILLIHGLFSTAKAWETSRRELQKQYDFIFGGHFDLKNTSAKFSSNFKKKNKKNFQSSSLKKSVKRGDFYTITFSQNYDLSYKEQAQEIAMAVEVMKNINDSDKVILIGHSMGGLAARAYIQLLKAKDVFMLITMGTPHYGSPLAYLRDNSEEKAEKFFEWTKKKLIKIQNIETNNQEKIGWLRRIKNKIFLKTQKGKKELMDFLDSKAFCDLQPASDALEELNQKPLPANIRYVCVVGDLARKPNLDVSHKRKTFLLKWRNLKRKTIRIYSKKHLKSKYKMFQKYLENYLDVKYIRKTLFDFDGVVPVLSQQLHHFEKEPKKYVVVYVAMSHMILPEHTTKIYQALAVGGAFI